MDQSNIQYIGEWLLPGQIGHFFTLLGMVAALYAVLTFGRAAWLETRGRTDEAELWKRLGRVGFGLNGLAVMGIFLVLFFLIFNHRFEYKYVWQHSSLSLPVHYMISCFWEGQEGSFLLWQFWTAVLGIVLISHGGKVGIRCANGGEFYAIVLGRPCSLGCIFLATNSVAAPSHSPAWTWPTRLFSKIPTIWPTFLKDGRELNPLLQNYWMVIHPPTLFLGFASTLIPFAYVMAALWKRDFTDWVRPTLAWSLFCGGVFGTGILMGGAWAYEALSFGGFWAWDPVENASFVPWLSLLAGIHTLLIYKHTGHALRATSVLLSLALWLVLYSTFLTRSGILGDTSVHSFTDLGMSGQLLVFMLSFVVLSSVLIAARWKTMPAPQKEEKINSREFWMFIASLLLVMLAALITIDTSWPVINKIFGTKKAIVDAVTHYNRYTLWFAVVIGLLSASIQYLRYKSSDVRKFVRNLAVSIVVSLVGSLAIAYALDMWAVPYVVLLFISLSVIVANTNYLVSVLKGKIRVAGGSVSHVGFGLLLLGILISSAKKEAISINTMGIDYGEAFKEQDRRENILLYKDKSVQMGDYYVTYIGDSIVEPNTYFKVRYEKKKEPTDQPTEVFTLYPNAQINPNMGLIANPATRHYLDKDIFTHVSSVPDKTQQKEEQSESLSEHELAVGDTAILKNSFLILKSINPNPTNPAYLRMPDDIAASAMLELVDVNSNRYTAEPVYFIRNSAENEVVSVIKELGLTIRFSKIMPDQGKIQLSVVETEVPADFIIMKAIVFPYINLVWLGSFVMVFGFLISMRHRLREGKVRTVRTAAPVPPPTVQPVQPVMQKP